MESEHGAPQEPRGPNRAEGRAMQRLSVQRKA
jgi:hypothetical protein